MDNERRGVTAEKVEEAVALAMVGSAKIVDFRDALQPYLVLRVRGHSASWLVKTRDRSLKIGSAIPPAKVARFPEVRRRKSSLGERFLGLREAQKLARTEWAKLGDPIEEPVAPASGWTWGKLSEEYKVHLSGMREDSTGRPIYPSEDSQSDVRGIFGRKEVARHDGRRLADLDEDWFAYVQEALHKTFGFDAYRKFRAYGQAALNWAAAFKRKESGLTGRKWWLLAEKRRRTSVEVEKKIARDKKLRAKKDSFKVTHLGMVLDRHERYCASRSGNERVSPGVRWGFWWDSLTGHRRGSGTWVAHADIEFQDPRGEQGWGLATWQPDVLKTHDPFVLPIPPFGLHIVNCCIRDWRAADKRANVERVTKWVFASRVIQSDAGDIAVSGSAMANHIRNMRGLREGHHRDHLKGVPEFSMHIVRSTMGDYILDETDLPPGTASLMIGHEIEGDKKTDLDRITRTSKRWYFQAQRIPEKTAAMRRWSEALLRAFKDAGGIYPD